MAALMAKSATAAIAAAPTPSLSKPSSSSLAPSPSALFVKFQGLRVSAPAAPRTSVSAVSNGCRTEMRVEAGIGAFGNKAGMATVFSEEGDAIPVTVIAFHEGNVVTQIKTEETDGYNAVQVGYKRVRQDKLNKPELGHLKKSGCVPVKHLGEFRLPKVEGLEVGQPVDIYNMFKPGDLVDVSGTSIGKGFQGTIKRYNFARGLMTHGSKSHRQPGTIGPGTTPGRVYPGKKMAGQMGNKTVKVRKLTVVRVDSENRCLLVKGAVPGKAGNLLRITPAKIVGKNIPPWVSA